MDEIDIKILAAINKAVVAELESGKPLDQIARKHGIHPSLSSGQALWP